MKRILIIAGAALLMSCSAKETQESSWEVYCKKYNVCSAQPTEEQENFYLDCYRGSVEEEEDMGWQL